jgi:hypothetical protein
VHFRFRSECSNALSQFESVVATFAGRFSLYETRIGNVAKSFVFISHIVRHADTGVEAPLSFCMLPRKIDGYGCDAAHVATEPRDLLRGVANGPMADTLSRTNARIIPLHGFRAPLLSPIEGSRCSPIDGRRSDRAIARRSARCSAIGGMHRFACLSNHVVFSPSRDSLLISLKSEGAAQCVALGASVQFPAMLRNVGHLCAGGWSSQEQEPGMLFHRSRREEAKTLVFLRSACAVGIGMFFGLRFSVYGELAVCCAFPLLVGMVAALSILFCRLFAADVGKRALFCTHDETEGWFFVRMMNSRSIGHLLRFRQGQSRFLLPIPRASV